MLRSCRTRTFVENEQLAPPHDRPRERENLPLPDGQVRAAPRDLRIERNARRVALVLQVEEPGGAQGVIEDGVEVFGERVQVLAERPAEELRLRGMCEWVWCWGM